MTGLSEKQKQDRNASRREIANCNERRRMQNINTGFDDLKNLIPYNGLEKLSKAAILQHSAAYIQQLQDTKLALIHDNHALKRRLGEAIDESEYKDIPIGDNEQPVPRKRTESGIFDTTSESEDEGGSSIGEGPTYSPSSLSLASENSKRAPDSSAELPRKRSKKARVAPQSNSMVTVTATISSAPVSQQFLKDTANIVQKDSSHLQHQSLDVIIEAIQNLEGDNFTTALAPSTVVS